MKPEEILGIFNSISIFFGVGIFLKNRFIKIMNFILAIMVIAFSLFLCYCAIDLFYALVCERKETRSQTDILCLERSVRQQLHCSSLFNNRSDITFFHTG